jgi:ribonuclease J
MIGDMEITAFLVDHSAFDAYAFLIKAGGKSLFYTGDFRGHGRKRRLFTQMIGNPPENVDYLVMEGTSLGRNETEFINEDRVEEKLIKIFNDPGKINIIYASGQNIDRIVSIFRACKRTGKIFVVDIYVATILTMLSKYGKIPFPSKNFSNLKVIYSRYTSSRLAKEDKMLLYQQRHFKISKKEIGMELSRYVMLVRPSMEVDLKGIANLENGNFIYSMWEGYKSKDHMIKFLEFFRNRSFTIYNVHTSGHADVPTLKKLVKAIQPKYIVPIHTFHKHDYKDIFSVPVLELEDGQVYSEPAGSETSPV